MLGLCEHGDELLGSKREDLFTSRTKQFLIMKTPHSGISWTSWTLAHYPAW